MEEGANIGGQGSLHNRKVCKGQTKELCNNNKVSSFHLPFTSNDVGKTLLVLVLLLFQFKFNITF
jgi:hypothetical protein